MITSQGLHKDEIICVFQMSKPLAIFNGSSAFLVILIFALGKVQKFVSIPTNQQCEPASYRLQKTGVLSTTQSFMTFLHHCPSLTRESWKSHYQGFGRRDHFFCDRILSFNRTYLILSRMMSFKPTWESLHLPQKMEGLPPHTHRPPRPQCPGPLRAASLARNFFSSLRGTRRP